jgi:hypothetical protein
LSASHVPHVSRLAQPSDRPATATSVPARPIPAAYGGGHDIASIAVGPRSVPERAVVQRVVAKDDIGEIQALSREGAIARMKAPPKSEEASEIATTWLKGRGHDDDTVAWAMMLSDAGLLEDTNVDEAFADIDDDYANLPSDDEDEPGITSPGISSLGEGNEKRLFAVMPKFLIGDYAENLVRTYLTAALGVELLSLQNPSGHGLDVTFVLGKGRDHAAFEYLLAQGGAVDMVGIGGNIDQHYNNGKDEFDKRRPTIVSWEIKANNAQLSKVQRDDKYIYDQASKFANGKNEELKKIGRSIMDALDHQQEPFFLLGRVILDQGKDVSLTFQSVTENTKVKPGTQTLVTAEQQETFWSSAQLGAYGEAAAAHWLQSVDGYDDVWTLEIEGAKGIDRAGVKGGQIHFFEIKTHVGAQPKGSGLSAAQNDPVAFVTSRLLNLMQKETTKEIEQHSIGTLPDIFDLLKIDWSQGVNDFQLESAFAKGNKDRLLRFRLVHVILPALGATGEVEVVPIDWGSQRYWSTIYEAYKSDL